MNAISRRGFGRFVVLAAAGTALAGCSYLTDAENAITGAGGLATIVTDANSVVSGIKNAVATIGKIVTIPTAVQTVITNGEATLQTILTNLQGAETAVASAPFVTQLEAGANSIINSVLGVAGVSAQAQTIAADLELGVETLLSEALTLAGVTVAASKFGAAAPALTPAQARALLASFGAK